MPDARQELFERIVDSMSRRDWDALDACHHPDYIGDWPQEWRLQRVEPLDEDEALASV